MSRPKPMLVATEGGLARTGPGATIPLGRPEYLIQQALMSRLGVETIELWQFHRIDSKVPRDEHFGVTRQPLDEAVGAQVGWSNVRLADVEAAAISPSRVLCSTRPGHGEGGAAGREWGRGTR